MEVVKKAKLSEEVFIESQEEHKDEEKDKEKKEENKPEKLKMDQKEQSEGEEENNKEKQEKKQEELKLEEKEQKHKGNECEKEEAGQEKEELKKGKKEQKDHMIGINQLKELKEKDMIDLEDKIEEDKIDKKDKCEKKVIGEDKIEEGKCEEDKCEEDKIEKEDKTDKQKDCGLVHPLAKLVSKLRRQVNTSAACLECGKAVQSYCQGCLVAVYCGVACQVQNWQVHREQCCTWAARIHRGAGLFPPALDEARALDTARKARERARDKTHSTVVLYHGALEKCDEVTEKLEQFQEEAAENEEKITRMEEEM